MGNQANVDFYTTSPVENIAEIATRVLAFLGVREDWAIFTRLSNADESWKERFSGVDADYEILGKRFPVDHVHEIYHPGKTLRVDWPTAEGSVRKRFTLEVWNEIPHDLLAGHVPGNHDLILGEHDVFGVETQDKEEDSYFGRATFSVHLWGYRCPVDIDKYREHVMQLPTFREIREGLSAILAVPVETRIYMNL